MRHEHMITFRMGQIWALLNLTIAFVIALFKKERKQHVWLIAERGVDARDNGFCFFMYMKEKHPEEQVYYVISKESPDRKRFSKYEKYLLDYRSLNHYVILWCAKYLVSTHLQGYFPYAGLGIFVKGIFPYYNNKIHINLKHGITLNYASVHEYKYAKWDLIIAGTIPEYNFIIERYGYPIANVALTGLARYDQLSSNPSPRQLLLMPTWREWIYEEKGFEQTQYAQRYASLIQSYKLNKLLEENNITLIFYPHHEIQKKIDFFRKANISKHIIIADGQNYDVQQLLKESALLITDYSSVVFDMAYMRKPVLCYQFDQDRFMAEHYQKGWFSYNDSFAEVHTCEETLINAIQHYITYGCVLKSEYCDYIDGLFPFHDNKNCERIYTSIINIHKPD